MGKIIDTIVKKLITRKIHLIQSYITINTQESSKKALSQLIIYKQK